MEGDERDLRAFDLLLQKTKRINLKPFTALEIPFGFRPKQIKAYKCKIVITMSDTLQWGFPIKGVTESKSV
jgi:hypothetical protein